MSRVQLLLLSTLLICALSVINATDQQRRIFIELDLAQGQERQLRQDWSQLQYQQGALSKVSRIESVAQRALKMRPVTSGLTHYLTPQVINLDEVEPLSASTLPQNAAKRAPQLPAFFEKGGR